MDLVESAWDRWGGDLLRFFRDLLAAQSPPGGEEVAARRVLAEMERLGLEKPRIDRHGNALAEVSGGGGRRLLLNAHTDIVSAGDATAWTRPPFGGEREGDRIYGRGACDTKGAVACQVYAAAAVARAGRPLRARLEVAAVVMEEVGGVGTLGLLEDGPPPDAALVGEPSDGCLMIGHRGRVQVEVRFRGKAFHAAVAGAGANPHWAEAAFLQGVRGIALPEDPFYGRASIQPTLVHTDNDSCNVVPGSILLTLDCRTLPGQDPEGLLREVRALAEASAGDGVTCRVEVPRVRWRTWTGVEREIPHVMPSFGTDPGDSLVREARAALAGVLDGEVEVRPWKFATDGGHLTGAGARVVGFGPGRQERAHTVDEFLTVEELRRGFEGTLACVRALDRALHAE